MGLSLKLQWFIVFLLSCLTIYFVDKNTREPDGLGNKVWYATQKYTVYTYCSILAFIGAYAFTKSLLGTRVELTGIFGGCQCKV
jgi:hypothetical protein